ncbi:glycosyltransferase family 32 protein [Oceanisphaera sp. KMM 10153]|uniref:glycosyltransferase family 32 protein n=1 Tax=Oceanisphaera submarina TaxID=3390193 RepID=UPI0039760CCE
MKKLPILVANRSIRLVGNIFKLIAYPFHFLLPNLRFTIPEYSSAKLKLSNRSVIPRTIWQTNFTNKCTLPVYMNYLFNRLMSLNCDYRYVSTEARGEYLQKNAQKEVYAAYMRLTNGAAQADLWRLVVLNLEGGVYMDIDATLVWPLDKLIGEENKAIYIKIDNNTRLTNYFIASAPNNQDLQKAIENVLYNIEHYDPSMGVYHSTGPSVLDTLLTDRNDIHTEDRKYVCIQGSFTNEHFQYLDRPRSKWTHINPADLVKNKEE